MRRKRLLIICGSLAAAFGLLLSAQPACSPGQCTQSQIDPNTPSTALECAAGLLCYQGQCIRSCSAGQERAQECSGDGDCSGSRPNCVDDFCSSCDEDEFCVPTLNICQAITEIDLEMIPVPPTPPPGAPKPPAPIANGYIDGGLRLEKDAGVEMPIDETVTHAGLIDIAQLEDYTSGARDPSSKVGLTVVEVPLNLQAPGLIWRVDPWDDTTDFFEPSSEIREELLGEDCALLQHTSYPDFFESADIGEIYIDSPTEFPNSIAVRLEAIFDGFEYLLQPTPPAELLRYSVLSPNEPHFLDVTSPGSEITGGSWPNPPPDLGEHVPFALVPTADTVNMLAAGINVSVASPGDLTVRWERIAIGSAPGEKVILRFRGEDYEVNCQVVEGNIDGSIVVKAGLMSSFLTRQNITAASAPIPIYFERAYARRLEVPPETACIDQVVPPACQDHNVAVRIRHTFIGTLRFQ